MTDDYIKDLVALYAAQSKHSAYQLLPDSLLSLLGNPSLNTTSRHEKARLDYILDAMPLKEQHVLDIGGNTGYFTFSAIENGASHVDCYEGNKEHAQFVRSGSLALGLGNQVKVFNEYFDFQSFVSEKSRYDVCLCLNVLHHLGDDFGDTSLSLDVAKQRMIECLNRLASLSKVVILQIGFNWKGDVTKPLFTKGTKEEMIAFVSNAVKDIWEIVEIAVADMSDMGLKYSRVDHTNLARMDQLGEFLNRPIFILKSKLISSEMSKKN